MSDQDLAGTGAGEMPRETTVDEGETPRPFFTTTRRQSEPVRLARVALREADYDYEKLSKTELLELARWSEVARDGTKEELVRALKRANVR